MDLLGEFLRYLGVAGGIFGLIIIAFPIAKLGFTRRWEGGLIIVAAIALIALGDEVSPQRKAFIAEQHQAYLQKLEQDQRQANLQRAEKERQDKIKAQRVANDRQGSECEVTLEHFLELREGMPYAAVAHILGCQGKLLSRSDIAGYTTVMVSWEAQGLFSGNMNAMFQNNSLVSKAQFGLK